MPKYSSIKSILVLLFTFAFLTACGGGGGSGSDTPTVTAVTPKVTIDTASQPNVTENPTTKVVTITALESGVGSGRVLATFTIPTGDSPVTRVVINEVDAGRAENTASRESQYFEAVVVDDIIKIRVREDAGIIPPGTYKVTLVITNSTGGQQTIEAEIVVSDVKEPVIGANQEFTVSEAAGTGDLVGTLAITNEDSAVITAITLTDAATQAVSTDFASDNEGKITVLPTASLDFDTNPTSYSLTAVAASDGGASKAETITILLGNEPDDLPTVTAKDYDVLEGRASGTIIATLEFDRGSSDVTFTLGGADAGSFTLDNTGVLKLATTAVADTTYALTAKATNTIGDSNEAAINVAVIPAPSWVGKTPQLMAIGDSITSGVGGVSETEFATTIAAAEADLAAKTTAAETAATADTKAGEAVTALGVDPAVPDFAAASAAATAAETAAAGTSAATATTAAKLAIAAATAAPANTALLTAARTAVTAAKTATAKALVTASTAKAAAGTALADKRKESVQRLSYRKTLGDLRDNDPSVAFDYMGSVNGPRSQDGSFQFVDNKHEGHSGFLIRQLYDVAAEYVCTQDVIDQGDCDQADLGTTITGGAHPDAGNTEGKSYLHYTLEDLGNVPDVALVMLGTNDMAFRISYADPVVTAKADMQGLIAVLRKANPNMIIFIAKIPPIDDPFGFNYNTASVTPYNDALAEIVATDSHATSQLFVVDQYTDFIGAGSEVDPIEETLHVGDGVHPNAAGEDILAQNWFDAIKAKLFTEVTPN